jgi:integrase
VFPSRNGTVLRPNNIHRRILKPTVEEAGAPAAAFHTFRHTCAAMLIAEGRNIVQISRWLGHHSPSFTLQRYGGLMNEHLGEALVIAPVDAPSVDDVVTNNRLTGATPLHDTQE